jgi:hypothetical protein
VTNELVRAMTYRRMYGAFIASLGAVALMLAANETFARSAAGHRGGFTSTHSISHRSVAQSLRHHRRNDVGILWPAEAGFFYGPSNGEASVDVTQPIPDDIPHTNRYDLPWDWAHRYPASERPYVPSCPAETVTVPGGHDGKEQTVSIMRCY